MKSKVEVIGIVIIISTSLLIGGIFLSHNSTGSIMSRGNTESPWPMFQYNPRHTGLSPYDTSNNKGDILWNYSLSNAQESLDISTPVIGPNGTIFAGVYDIQGMSNYSLIAVNPNGTLKWNVTLDGTVIHSPAFDSSGMLHVYTTNGSIYSIYPDNGTVKWIYSLTPHQTGEATLTIADDGTIYLISSDNNVTAISPSGSLKWRYPVDPNQDTIPTVGADGTVYVGTGMGDVKASVYALTPDGILKWNHTINLNDSAAGTPVIDDDGYIYVPVDVEGALTYVYSFSPGGSVRWVYPSNSSLPWTYSLPCIGPNGNLYLYTVNSNTILSLSSGGNRLWNITVKDHTGGDNINLESMAIGGDGTIYVSAVDYSSGQGKQQVLLIAYTLSGGEKWRTYLGNAEQASHLAIDSSGIIYVGTSNGTIYAIGSENQVPELTPTAAYVLVSIIAAVFIWRRNF